MGYTSLLALRLLNETSCSVDAEERLIVKMKTDVGA